MKRTLVALTLVLVMTTPLALAQDDQPVLPTAADAPALDEPDAGSALRDGLAAAGTAVGDAGTAVADGLAAAGALALDGVKALATGAALLAKGLWSALTFAVGAIAEGVAAVATALWTGILIVATAIGHALAAAGRAAWSGLATLVSSLGAALAFVGTLLIDGARWSAAHPRETAIAGASAAGAGGLLHLLRRYGALLGLGGMPLYTRLAPGQMLDNEARARVYELIRTQPGKHVSALAEELDLGWGTITYHLQRLEEGRLVTSRTVANRKCYFATGAEIDGEARTAMAALASEPARRVVDAVRAQPGIVQKDLAAALDMSQALASWHVKRLVKSGVLVAQRVGRANALTVAAHVPHTEPAAGSAAAPA